MNAAAGSAILISGAVQVLRGWATGTLLHLYAQAVALAVTGGATLLGETMTALRIVMAERGLPFTIWLLPCGGGR